jgi:hypothetical protein
VPSKPTQKGEFVSSSTNQEPTRISIHRPTHVLSPETQSKRYGGYPKGGKKTRRSPLIPNHLLMDQAMIAHSSVAGGSWDPSFGLHFFIQRLFPPPIQRGATRDRSDLSLEVRMGCGFGACYGCTINTKKGLKQVCRDGPVFELGDIIWQEVRI